MRDVSTLRRTLAAVALTALAVVGLAACSAQPEVLRVTYYYLPG